MIVVGVLTLRDYFVGQALAGYCASPNFDGEGAPKKVEWSYADADAMLAQRNKEPAP